MLIKKVKVEKVKKTMMKVLALITTVVTLAGCGNSSAEDVPAMLNDAAQGTEAIGSGIMNRIKEEVQAESKATAEPEPEPAAKPESTAKPTARPAEKKPAETAKPAEAKPAKTTARPAEKKPAEKKPTGTAKLAFQCLCGFVADTEEELNKHIITESHGAGAEIQVTGPQAPATQAPESQAPAVTNPGNQAAESQAPASQTPTPQAPAVTAPAEPAHTHVWKEHVAETQVWIPNIVVVEDYETQRVAVGGLYICTTCGYETSDLSAMDNHCYESLLNGGGCGNYQDIVQYADQQVLVGTHEEDQGHYETSTYVDYYYCDCGATK